MILFEPNLIQKLQLRNPQELIETIISRLLLFMYTVIEACLRISTICFFWGEMLCLASGHWMIHIDTYPSSNSFVTGIMYHLFLLYDSIPLVQLSQNDSHCKRFIFAIVHKYASCRTSFIVNVLNLVFISLLIRPLLIQTPSPTFNLFISYLNGFSMTNWFFNYY